MMGNGHFLVTVLVLVLLNLLKLSRCHCVEVESRLWTRCAKGSNPYRWWGYFRDSREGWYESCGLSLQLIFLRMHF